MNTQEALSIDRENSVAIAVSLPPFVTLLAQPRVPADRLRRPLNSDVGCLLLGPNSGGSWPTDDGQPLS